MVLRDAPAAVEIFYPETDGMPLADGFEQEEYYLYVRSLIRARFIDVEGAVASGNTFIYYREGDPNSWVAPDCYVALNVSAYGLASIKRFNTYRVWEVGKVPDFALEIASRSTATNDLTDKRDLYARLGIAEYWRYDPTGGSYYGEPLVGERLVDGEYRRFQMRQEPGGVRCHSPALNLDFVWDGEGLSIYDPAGMRWLQSLEEAEARAENERVAREVAEAQAESERSARESAESRMAELEAELRRLKGG